MRIQQSLPQFNNTPALIVVTGRVSAILYLAHNGRISIRTQLMERAEYFSDNEGFFETRSARQGVGRSKTLSSGSVREPYDHKRVERFLKHLRTALWSHVQNHPTHDIYLFTPKPHELLDHVQTKVRKKVRATIAGDFVQEHQLKILERLQKHQQAKVFKLAPPENARRILHKAKIAHQSGEISKP